MKYKNWLDEWLKIYVQPNCKQRTYNKYSAQIKRYITPRLGEYELNDLTAIILQKFVVDLSESALAGNTINSIISVLKSSLKRAVILNVADREYTSAIVRPKVREKTIESFTVGEQKRIENYISERNKPSLFGIMLCLYTGLRIGELLALTWKDIDFKNAVMHVRKSCYDSWQNGKYKKVIDTPKTDNSVRSIPLPKLLLTKLKAIYVRSNCKFVVCGRDKEQGVAVRSYQKTFERLLNNLNIPHKGFHALRHTFATRALECGMDVKTLAEIMGHSNPTITLKRYAHSMLEHKTEMMNRLSKFMK